MPALEGSTVLVTGAGGFIGSWVTSALLGAGAKVRALLGAPGHAVRAAPAGVEAAFVEIGDLDQLKAWARGAELVVHAAGLPSVAASFAAPAEYARVHVSGTAALLEACGHAKVRRLVYISSAEVYGQPTTDPVPEDHVPAPRSPYGAAKLGAERFVEVCSDAYGFESVILRPFSIYGPGASPQSVLWTILRQAREESAIEVADPRPIRDFCFVSDLVDAILLSSTRSMPAQVSVFNVGSGVGTSVADLARLAGSLCGRNLRLCVARTGDRPASAGIRRLVADLTRCRQQLGWHPRVALRQGLVRCLSAISATALQA